MAEHLLEVLSDDECQSLLEKHQFGRLGVVVEGSPEIFPVNYAFRGGRVVIRTDPGTKLEAAALGLVAFEVDEVDHETRTGWSVLVKGTGYDVTDSIDDISADLRHAVVDTWAPGERTHWLRVEPTSITGRRVRRD